MTRRWQWLRIASCTVWGAPVTVRWLFALGTWVFCAGCGSSTPTPLLPGENYSQKDALAGIAEGKPIVLAILRFEADTGCWPHELCELVPEYLLVKNTVSWRYHTFNHDDFALVYLGPLSGGTLHYDHDNGKRDGWNVWWVDQREQQHIERIEVDQPKPPLVTVTPVQQANKRFALLSRRIETMPDRIAHRIGMMKHFFDLRQFENARTICVACIQKWPDYWWPYLMLAKIDRHLGDQTDSESRLKVLAERWDDFFGYAFLAQFYYDQKDSEKCKSALRQALKPALTRHKDQYSFEQIGHRPSYVDDYYYHNAAYLAYRLPDRRLCLEICDRWREFAKDIQHYRDPEEMGLRVVCATNEADWGKAEGLLAAMRQLSEYSSWQDDGIKALERVVREKNAHYEYDPKRLRPNAGPLLVQFDYK